MQIEQCLVELHIPQYTPLWPQMQALISNNQELRCIMYITVFSIPLILAFDRVCHISIKWCILIYYKSS